MKLFLPPRDYPAHKWLDCGNILLSCIVALQSGPTTPTVSVRNVGVSAIHPNTAASQPATFYVPNLVMTGKIAPLSQSSYVYTLSPLVKLFYIENPDTPLTQCLPLLTLPIAPGNLNVPPISYHILSFTHLFLCSSDIYPLFSSS